MKTNLSFNSESDFIKEELNLQKIISWARSCNTYCQIANVERFYQRRLEKYPNFKKIKDCQLSLIQKISKVHSVITELKLKLESIQYG